MLCLLPGTPLRAHNFRSAQLPLLHLGLIHVSILVSVSEEHCRA